MHAVAWALDNAPDGDLSSLGADELAEVAEWPGKDPQLFMDALIESGFIDTDMRIHDWDDYAGKLIEQRTVQREQSCVRQQKRREKIATHKADSNALVTRDNYVTEALVTRDFGDVTQSPYPAVPNPTEQYQTRKKEAKKASTCLA